jgi:hypothetical protein
MPGLRRGRALSRPPTAPRMARPEDRLRGLVEQPAPAKSGGRSAPLRRLRNWIAASYARATRKSSWGASVQFVPLGVLVLLAIFVAGCSDSAPVAPASNTLSAEMVEKNCADPQWKDKNLGLWYSVCRRPISW